VLGRRLLILPLSLFLTLLLSWVATAETGNEVGDAENRLDLLRKQIDDLKSVLHGAEKRGELLERELKETEQEIGGLARRLRVLAGSLQRQRARLQTLRKQQTRRRHALAGERQALARQVRSAYAMGRQERLKILLNQQDPAMVSRVMVYYDYFNRARTRRMEKIARALEKLQQTETEISAEEERLLALQQQELEQQNRLEQNRQVRKEVLTALNADIRSKGTELKNLQLNEKELQALLGRLEKELADILSGQPLRKAFPALKGKMKWPAKGRLAARFGTERSGGLRWDGVLISAPEGREVRAVHHGRVAFADWLRGFGLLVIIDHGNGYMTLYGHNQTLFKETGEWVEAGEPIALVGSSGGRLNSGVYFGIRHKGRPVNPRKWCRRVKGNRVGWEPILKNRAKTTALS
jgi:septal ring factor EnvC (AmiA/AmiB activator)